MFIVGVTPAILKPLAIGFPYKPGWPLVISLVLGFPLFPDSIPELITSVKASPNQSFTDGFVLLAWYGA